MRINRLIILAVFIICGYLIPSLQAQSASCFNLDMEWVTGATTGETSCVDVRVRNMGDVIGMQYTHLYDAQGLEFVEIVSGEISISAANFNDAAAGVLTFAWTDFSLQPTGIPDGSVLYSICFEVINDNTSRMEVSFANGPTPIEFVEAPSSILPNYGLIHGGVAIGSVDAAPDFTEACVSGIACTQSSDGSIAVTMSGASLFTFAWSGPNNYANTTEDLSDLEVEGFYELWVTGVNGVSRSALFGVAYEEEGNLVINAQPDVCGGAGDGSLSASINGSNNPHTYLWSTGATTAAITNLAAGTYTVTATNSTSSCTYIKTAEVVSTDGFTATAVITHTGCQTNSGAIDLSVTATPDQLPLTYSWSEGSSTEDISNLPAGTYTVTVTGTDCMSSFVFTVGTDHFSVEGSVTQPNCQNNAGAISLSQPDENGPFTYAWSNGANSRDLNGLAPGSYTVTVTHTGTACSAEKTFNLNAGDLIGGWTYECTFFTDTTVVTLSTILWNPSALPIYYSYSDGSQDTVQTMTEASSILVADNQTFSVTITDGNGCQTEIDNMAIDCSGNNGAVNIKLDPVVTQVESAASFCLTVRADNFVDISGAQFSLAWDPALLTYTGVSAIQFPNNGNFFNQTPQDIIDGRLRFAWVIDDVANGFSVPDNGALFDVCFNALAEGQTSIVFADTPIPIEFSNTVPQTLNHFTTPAQIQIGPAVSANAALRLVGQTVTTTDPVCVPVVAEEFEYMLGMQGTISWDENILSFTEVKDLNLSGLNHTNFGTNQVTDGILTYSWTEPNLIPYTATPGQVLFSLCFTPLTNTGYSDVNFASTPTLLEMIGGDNEILTGLYTDGFVAITENVVWPGDTDQNEVVDHFDLLNIGLGFGQTGPTRPQASTMWVAQYGMEWSFATPETDINYRHADTNGDGQVDASDVSALEQNWDEVTTLWTPSSGQQRNLTYVENLNTAPIYVQSETVVLGETVGFKIMYGDETTMAEEVYGIAFSIVYDPEAIVAGSIQATVENSWLGTLDTDLLLVARDYPDEHRLDIALTRTDGASMNGYGQIATMYVTIEDVIFRDDLYEMEFAVENVRAITPAEMGIHTNNLATISTIDVSTNTHENRAFAQLNIYPNPVTNRLFIQTGTLKIDQIELIHVSGLSMGTFTQVDEISVEHLPAGTYGLRFSGPDGKATRRFIKL